MAKLTDQIDTANSGKRIIQPADTSGSFLGGLSKLAGGLISASDANYKSSRELGTTKVENEMAIGVQKLRDTATSTARADPGQSDGLDQAMTILDVPQDVKTQALELDKTKRAVSQGRAAATTFDVGMENFVSTMTAKYPEYASNIAQYMRQMGLEHYTHRELNTQEAVKDSQQAAVAEGRAATIKHAIDSGYGTAGFSDEQLYSVGQDLQKAEYLQDQHTKALQNITTEQNIAKGANELDDHQEKKSDELAYSAGTAYVNAHVGGMLTHLTNLVALAGTDDEAFNQLSATAPELFGALDEGKRRYIQNLQAQGVKKDTVDAITKQFDDRIAEVKDIYFGDKSRFAQTQRSYQAMQTQLGIASEKALPVFAGLKRMFGAGAMDVIFDGNTLNALSPELKARVKADILRYDPMHPNEGLSILQEIGALAQGNASLADIPEAKVTSDYIKGITAGVRGSRERILDAGPDTPEDHKAFLGALSNLNIASMRIQPGYKNTDGIHYATQTLLEDKNIKLLDSEMKDPAYSRQATQVFLATRASAAQLLEVSKMAAPEVPGQSIIQKNGVFQVQVKQQPGGNINIDQMGGTGYQPVEDMTTSVDPRMQALANDMNWQVNFLVATAKLDPRTANATPDELRAHYALGTPLKNPEGETKKAPNFKQELEAFKQETHQFLMDEQTKRPYQDFNANKATYQPVAHAAAAQYGVPLGVADWLFGHEAGWNPNVGGTKIDKNKDGKPDSSARGIGQFITETGKKYGLVGDGFDYRDDPTRAIPAAIHYLSDLARANGGDWLKALHQYGTLARSNFDSDAKYQQAVNSAKASING